jgi:hypothetical protein
MRAEVLTALPLRVEPRDGANGDHDDDRSNNKPHC